MGHSTAEKTAVDTRTNGEVQTTIDGRDVPLDEVASGLPADPDPAGVEPESPAEAKSKTRPYTVLERLAADALNGDELAEAIAAGRIFLVREEDVVAVNDRMAIMHATSEDERGEFIAKSGWKVRTVGDPARKPSRVVR